MSDLWSKLGRWCAGHAGIVLGSAAAVTILLAVGLPRLEFATGQDSYLNEGTQVYEDNVRYQDLFGGQAMITLFSAQEDRSVLDLFTPDNAAAMDEMETELQAIDGVLGVVSPLTAVRFTESLVAFDEGGSVLDSPAGQILARAVEREATEGTPDAAAARSADSLRTLERIEAFGPEDKTFENPEWVEFLLVDNQGEIRKALRPFFVFPPGVEPTLENASFAQMVVRLEGNASIDEEGAASDAIVAVTSARTLDGFDSLTTGAPVLLKDINDYLQGGMLTLGGIAVLVMLVVLAVAFRVRTRFLPLATTLLAVIWTFGFLGLIGFELSLVTISALPILIGMGIDFAIQVHTRIDEEIAENDNPRPYATTLRWLGPPLLVTVAAAVIAFLSMQISLVPMVRDFGVTLAIGIVLLLVAGLTLPTAWIARREASRPTTHRTVTSTPFSERVVVKLGSLPRKAVLPLAVLAIGTFLFGILVEDAFKIQSDPEKWVNQDTQVIRDIEELRSKTGSSSELGMFIESDDIFSDETAAYVTEVARAGLAEEDYGLLTASSIYTTVAFLMEIPGATDLAPTGEDVRLAFEVAPESVQLSTLNEAEGAGNLIFRTEAGSLEERKVQLDDLEARLDGRVADPERSLASPENIRTTPSGLAVVGVGLLENVQANRALLTYVALGAVTLFLLARYRSLSRTVIALVPVLMAVGASSLVVAVVGFELSPLTTISGPLVIATCTEFASLIMARYLEERNRGLTPEEASTMAGMRTGKAFVTSALTTVGGFLVLTFSALPLLRDFGAIVSLNISVALLSALVVQPPLMLWTDHRGWLGTSPIGGGEDHSGDPAPTATTAES
jgi:hydrophobe/amphiphile efflux-3 (HAE3) family protein